MPRAVLAFLLAVLSPALTARAQEDTIKLKADLVTTTAAVTGRDGRPVKSLKAEDFVVYEDGVEQKVAHFAPTEEPFTLLLLLDISGSTRDDVSLMKQAARHFLAELRPDDKVGVIVFSGDVELIADFGDGRERVEAALARVVPSESTGPTRFSPKTGTSFYDALYLAVEESPLKRVEGRKAIICMSDGVDSVSKMGYKEVARLVEGSGASAYFLELNTEEATLAGLLKPRTDPGFINFSQSQMNRYFDKHDPDSPDRHLPRKQLPPPLIRSICGGLYDIARGEMREMAERTGGRVYPVRALGDLGGVYKQVAEELRHQYSLGYYPLNEAHDGRWRTIRVEVRRRDATVRARSGYWAPGKRF